MIVLHQVNCMGVMGAGFAKYVRNTFPDCYTQYKEHCSKPNVILLGTFTTYTKVTVLLSICSRSLVTVDLKHTPIMLLWNLH